MVGGSLHSFAEQSLVGRLDDAGGGASRTNVAAPVGETGVVAISGEIRGLRSGEHINQSDRRLPTLSGELRGLRIISQ